MIQYDPGARARAVSSNRQVDECEGLRQRSPVDRHSGVARSQRVDCPGTNDVRIGGCAGAADDAATSLKVGIDCDGDGCMCTVGSYRVRVNRKANGHDGEYRRLFRRREDLQHGQDDLRRQAAQEFAALNGWRWTAHPFLARTLARGGTHEGRRDGGGGWGTFGVRDETIDGWMHHVLFDHPLFFREIARPTRPAGVRAIPVRTTGKAGEKS